MIPPRDPAPRIASAPATANCASTPSLPRSRCTTYEFGIHAPRGIAQRSEYLGTCADRGKDRQELVLVRAVRVGVGGHAVDGGDCALSSLASLGSWPQLAMGQRKRSRFQSSRLSEPHKPRWTRSRSRAVTPYEQQPTHRHLLLVFVDHKHKCRAVSCCLVL